MGALTEYIFSHALALQQSGRLKNEIFVHNRDVYIMNIDHTVLLNFQLPAREPSFEKPVNFSANDYDSENFREENGKIIFTQKSNAPGIIRTKTCSGSDKTFDDVKKTFGKFYSDPTKMTHIKFIRDILSSLEDNLSHIELSADGGQWKLIQRDIYTGNIIELKRDKATGGGFGLKVMDNIKNDFGPIGIRTNDFMALFQFNEIVNFYFPPDADGYCLVTGETYKMKGIIGTCVYDEMGTLKIAKKGKPDGWEIKKNGRSKRQADSTVGKRTRRRKN
jgi:hypothetical protein